jgi:hypothetical protein
VRYLMRASSFFPLLCPLSFLSFQFNFDDRWEQWEYLQPSSIVDTTNTPIDQPELEQWQFWVHYERCYCVKYEILCSFGVPRIIGLTGPWKGAASDKGITLQTYAPVLKQGEKLMGDKSYRGDDVFMVPYSGHRYNLESYQLAWNADVYSARQRVERLIKRLKQWKCTETRWRLSLEFHSQCVRAAGKLTNLSLIFEPL